MDLGDTSVGFTQEPYYVLGQGDSPSVHGIPNEALLSSDQTHPIEL